MSLFPGVAKGAGDTIWVLHRGGKPWDAATFFSGGRAEHITDPSPVRGPVVLQLKQVSPRGVGIAGSQHHAGAVCTSATPFLCITPSA